MHDNQIKTLEEIACNACFQWLVVLVRAPQRNKTYRPFIHKSLGVLRGSWNQSPTDTKGQLHVVRAA